MRKTATIGLGVVALALPSANAFAAAKASTAR